MIRQLPVVLAATLLLVAASPSPACAQQYAASVIDYVQGPGTGIFLTGNVLGGPDNLSSNFMGTLSLGAGGALTLGFPVTIRDGSGADFIVFENAFELLAPPTYTQGSGASFTEACFVEVSTNGIDFARFPTSYSGPPASHGVFGGSPMGSFAGFAGHGPNLADVVLGTVDIRNAALCGGDAFDLSDLDGDPLVLAGLVDLQAIQFVRLIDVVEGAEQDSLGNTIWDDRGNDPLDSADIDAVAVLRHHSEPAGAEPILAMSRDVFDRIVLEIGDPAGLGALDATSFTLSLNFLPLTPADVATYFAVTAFDTDSITLTSTITAGSVPFDFILGAAIGNTAGKLSSATLVVQP